MRGPRPWRPKILSWRPEWRLSKLRILRSREVMDAAAETRLWNAAVETRL